MTKLRKKTILTCLDCGETILGGSHLSRHVQQKHSYSSYDEYKIKHNLIKTTKQLLDEGAVECKICGLISHDLTSHITRKHKMSILEYKHAHGSIRSEQYLNNQSERILGDKNPAYDHQGKFSPFSDKFIYAHTTDKEELKKKVSDSHKTNGNNNTTLAYWIKLGFSEAEAKEQISNRQRTFTIEKCIEKYGEVKGTQRWVDRQELWHNSCKKNRRCGFSMISQTLFWEIFNKLININSIYFAELDSNKSPDYSGVNNEYKLRLSSTVLLPDFIDLDSRKIIEFDGTYWHGELKRKYPNRLRDVDRDKLLINEGYDVLHIAEDKYNENPKNTLELCLRYLNA